MDLCLYRIPLEHKMQIAGAYCTAQDNLNLNRWYNKMMCNL
jgi:hypothetical protein